MQQKLGSLHVFDLVRFNAMVKELLSLKSFARSLSCENINTVTLTTLSDTSRAGLREVYGQSKILSSIKINHKTGPAFHTIAWTSHKQRKIMYSSYGAKILAAADADDKEFHLGETNGKLFLLSSLKHQLLLDSKSLFETISTLHHSDDYRLRRIVARMQNNFESNELNSSSWILGSENYADGFTKRKISLSGRLNAMLRTKTWTGNLPQSYSLDTDTWK